MPVRLYYMPFHRAVGKVIKCINDRNDRYWFYYCYFMQTEYISPRLDFYDKIFFFSHNTELLFVKEVIFVFGCW